MAERAEIGLTQRKTLALHGWLGLSLVLCFWIVNWGLEGTRTAWAFFPLWLGYCLSVDALVLRVRGTSLLQRSWRKYVGLFIVSAPSWWLFEVFNSRLLNWEYLGRELFTDLEYFFLATINFSIVIPAVFGTAELVSTLPWIRRMKSDLVIRPGKFITGFFFGLGVFFLFSLFLRPTSFYPLVWLAVFFILDPLNVWLGNRSVLDWLRWGNWKPLVSLCLGALVTGFFWEMWNFYSYPKWVYHVPGAQFLHIFEMPLLGYGGYLPFALELFALYHLIVGLTKQKKESYMQMEGE